MPRPAGWRARRRSPSASGSWRRRRCACWTCRTWRRSGVVRPNIAHGLGIRANHSQCCRVPLYRSEAFSLATQIVVVSHHLGVHTLITACWGQAHKRAFWTLAAASAWRPAWHWAACAQGGRQWWRRAAAGPMRWRMCPPQSMRSCSASWQPSIGMACGHSGRGHLADTVICRGQPEQGCFECKQPCITLLSPTALCTTDSCHNHIT